MSNADRPPAPCRDPLENRPSHSAATIAGQYKYADFESLGGIRDRIARDFAPNITGIRVLDVGIGIGGFSIALANALPHVHVVGIDIVDYYVRLARRRAIKLGLETRCSFARRDVLSLPKKTECYDAATFFLSLCDILRWGNLEDVLSRLDCNLKRSSTMVICEGFPEDSRTLEEEIGFDIGRRLGYRYLRKDELLHALQKRGYSILSTKRYLTNRRPLSPEGVVDFIRDECLSCTLDNAPVEHWSKIWKASQPQVESIGAVEIDAHVTAVVAVRE